MESRHGARGGLRLHILFQMAEREAKSWNIQVPPDIVVEVASSTDYPPSLNDKARMWLNYGVPAVWVVNPGRRVVEVHQSGTQIVMLDEEDTLDGARSCLDSPDSVGDIFNL